MTSFQLVVLPWQQHKEAYACTVKTFHYPNLSVFMKTMETTLRYLKKSTFTSPLILLRKESQD